MRHAARGNVALEVIIRRIKGYELMALMGWDASFFMDRVLPNCNTLSSMAGNVFSAFAVGT